MLNLLGLLPSDGQQTGDALGELALSNDDQVPYSPRAQQVPVGRGREEEVRGLWKRKSSLSSKSRKGEDPAPGKGRQKGATHVPQHSSTEVCSAA